jgi:hypothetical protein
MVLCCAAAHKGSINSSMSKRFVNFDLIAFYMLDFKELQSMPSSILIMADILCLHAERILKDKKMVREDRSSPMGRW